MIMCPLPHTTHTHTHLSHRYLNLHGSNIRKMEALEPCTNLRVLVLSFNEVHKVEGIAHMKHLERLEVNTDVNRVQHNNMSKTCFDRLQMIQMFTPKGIIWNVISSMN